MSVTPMVIGWAVLVILALAVLATLRRILRKPPQWIAVDGSNVMFWDGNEARAETLRRVVTHLKAQGYTPVVWFDANAGYKLSGRYERADRLARRIGLPPRQVVIAVRGQPADPLVLEGARHLDARVVTNDRFRDWQAQFPEITRPGHLVRGRVRDGRVVLQALDDACCPDASAGRGVQG